MPSTGDACEELSSTDLLIRAITTILSLLWPESKNPTSRSRRHIQRLNRLSLLFVPAFQAGDMAAITAVVTHSHVYVEAVQGSKTLFDSQNPVEPAPLAATDIPGPKKLKAELVEDPLRFCFTRGVAAITPDAHGAALHKLLTHMYELAPSCPEEESSRDSLRRYIYCFCHKKILRRLQYRILGHRARFLGLFLQTEKLSPNTLDDFQRRSKVTPALPKLSNASEAWLYYCLVERYPDEIFGPEPTAGQPYRLQLGENQLWRLWEFFATCREDLDLGLTRLDSHTRGGNPDSIAEAEEILDSVAQLMGALYHFVHASPTFWSLVVAMAHVLSNRMREDNVPEDARPLTSPTSSTGSLGPPHESNPGSAEHSDGEDSDDDSESEGAKGAVKLSGIALKIRTWLRRVTRWHEVISELSQGHLARAVLNKQLIIHVDVAPEAVQPERQASLLATVESLEGRGEASEKLEWILSRARDVYKDQDLAENTAAHALVNASIDDKASLERWETLFPSPSVHCGAHLAYTMHQKQAQNALIGVSKRCCYCCTLLLRKLGSRKDDVSYDGKVYPCPPPSAMSPEVKEYILSKLKRRLERHLAKFSSGLREPDFSSRPETEHVVIHGYRRVVNRFDREYFSKPG